MDPLTSKEEWIAKVEEELGPSRTWDDLQWLVDEGIEIDPFYHPDDNIESIGPIVWRDTNAWQIGVHLEWPFSPNVLKSAQTDGLEYFLVEVHGLDLPDFIDVILKHFPAATRVGIRLLGSHGQAEEDQLIRLPN
ncbi:MAG: hypothetical protein OEQ53_06915, partial [Saprospiraceae bacterium]|nr:hypothetical protein [Saprospiraceae bacterium]